MCFFLKITLFKWSYVNFSPSSTKYSYKVCFCQIGFSSKSLDNNLQNIVIWTLHYFILLVHLLWNLFYVEVKPKALIYIHPLLLLHSFLLFLIFFTIWEGFSFKSWIRTTSLWHALTSLLWLSITLLILCIFDHLFSQFSNDCSSIGLFVVLVIYFSTNNSLNTSISSNWEGFQICKPF